MAIVIEGKMLDENEIVITKVKALPLMNLPKRYLKGYPHVYSVGVALHIHTNKKELDVLYPGKRVSREHFEKLLNVISQAGDRLHKINRKFRIEI